MALSWETIWPTALALCLAAVAALIGTLLGFPAPFITAPSLLLAVVGVATNWKMEVATPMRNTAFVAIGLTVGSAATPDLLAAARAWPLSITGLILALTIIMALGTEILRRSFGYRRRDGLLACTPGHLSFVLALAADDPKTDARRVAMVQSVRLLFLTLAVPFLLKALGLMPPGSGMPSGEIMGWVPLLILVISAVSLGLLLLRLNVPAALLLAAMGLSMLAHAMGWVTGRPPTWMTIAGFTVLGALIGSRFSGVTWALLRQSAGAGLLMTVLSFAVALGMAVILSPLLETDLVTLLIAFAPGGLETMAALAIIMDADATFVAAHHLARMLALPALVTAFLFLQKRGRS